MIDRLRTLRLRPHLALLPALLLGACQDEPPHTIVPNPLSVTVHRSDSAVIARPSRVVTDSGDPARTSPIREWIGSFQFLFQNDNFSIISEFAYIYQDDKTSGTSFENYTAYFQLGYHISDEWTPYFRIDFRDMDQGDPYFAPTGRDLDWYEIVIGARFDFLNNAALKFEVGFGEREERGESSAITDESYIRVGVQLAFVF